MSDKDEIALHKIVLYPLLQPGTPPLEVLTQRDGSNSKVYLTVDLVQALIKLIQCTM